MATPNDGHPPGPHGYVGPVRASVDVTYACDLRCIHCRTNTWEIPIEIRRKMLTLDDLRRVCLELDDLRVFEITLTGGEPTLRSGFYDLLAVIPSLSFSTVTLITNAARLTQPQVDTIVASGVRSIRVSIDGTRQVFKDVRKKDVFDAVLANASYIATQVENFKVLTTVMTTNATNVFQLVDLLRARGMRRHDLILVRAHGRGGKNRLLLSEQQALHLHGQVEEFKRNVAPSEYDLNLNAPFLTPDWRQNGPEDVVMYPYTHKISSIAISATGDVTMNRLFSPIPVGNVKDASLREIWLKGQDLLAAEASEFSDQRLRGIFWAFEDGSAPPVTALLDRQIAGNAPVR